MKFIVKLRERNMLSFVALIENDIAYLSGYRSDAETFRSLERAEEVARIATNIYNSAAIVEGA